MSSCGGRQNCNKRKGRGVLVYSGELYVLLNAGEGPGTGVDAGRGGGRPHTAERRGVIYRDILKLKEEFTLVSISGITVSDSSHTIKMIDALNRSQKIQPVREQQK